MLDHKPPLSIIIPGSGDEEQVTTVETGNIVETLDDINQWGGGNGNTYYVVAYETSLPTRQTIWNLKL